jgi:hypothetical protein
MTHKIGDILELANVPELTKSDRVLAYKGKTVSQLGIDRKPRKGSNNVITSGALYDAIKGLSVVQSVGSGFGQSGQTPSLQQVTLAGNYTTQGIVLKSADLSKEYLLEVDSNGHLVFTGGLNQNAHFSGDVTAYSAASPPPASWWDDLPIATDTVLGGVKEGTNITIDPDGTINGTSGGTSYTAGDGLTLSGTTFSLGDSGIASTISLNFTSNAELNVDSSNGQFYSGFAVKDDQITSVSTKNDGSYISFGGTSVKAYNGVGNIVQAEGLLYAYGQDNESNLKVRSEQGDILLFGTNFKGMLYGADYSSGWGTIDNSNLYIPHVGWIVNYVTSNGVWDKSVNDISYVAGNVGIKTATPDEALEVAGYTYGNALLAGTARSSYIGLVLGGGSRLTMMEHTSSGHGGLYNQAASEWWLYGVNNGAVNLRFNNSPKLETATDGVDVTGELRATGDVVAYST